MLDCDIYNGEHTRTHKYLYTYVTEIATGKGISLLIVWNFGDCKPFFHLKQLLLLWNFLIM